MIAAIRIRGTVDTEENVEKTMESLNLDQKNKCVILEESNSVQGMLNKAKDYITFGRVAEESLEKLEERKGEEVSKGETVRLSPPTGGFRDTKKQVGQGGSLGEREQMNDLINKMV